MTTSKLKQIPGVDKILNTQDLKDQITKHGRDVAVFATRKVLKEIRDRVQTASNQKSIPTSEEIVQQIIMLINSIVYPSLKRVINGTGVILHTNLGRAPLGEKVVDAIRDNAGFYSNLEFDLEKGQRGQRNAHITAILRYITGAEHAVVVNNNAAAIVLVLNTLARGKEVIISRSELIEIGGSFRIPDIMAASGVRMVEVGTTNRTRLSDYKKAISPKTGLIFKAHRSNFTMSGFTEEVSLKELSTLAKEHNIFFVYDIGSGLIRKSANITVEEESDVKSALKEGPDVVTFSCDKLLGGPQGGIIAGKKECIQRCSRAPLMRALRVCKLTLSALAAVCQSYLQEELLTNDNPVFRMIEESLETTNKRAHALCEALKSSINSDVISFKVIDSKAQVGGGTLPGFFIDSKGVIVKPPKMSAKKRELFAETLHAALMKSPNPVVAVLRKGAIVFDARTIFDKEIETIATTFKNCITQLETA